jgi:hypothetical protein
MKKAAQKKPPQKKQKPITPLRPVGVTLSQGELDILEELTTEQSTLTGRTISNSAVIRGLLRFAKRGIEALALRDAIEEEVKKGRRWGVDELGKIQGRGRPRT